MNPRPLTPKIDALPTKFKSADYLYVMMTEIQTIEGG